MKPLQARKQLLVAESELNRIQLIAECEKLGTGFRSVTGNARKFSEIASSAAVLVAALAALWQRKHAAPKARPSWLRAIFESARLVSSIWHVFRSPAPE